MNKASFIYISMLLGLAVGLAVIIPVGRTLRAVPEIHGEWEITWIDPPAGSSKPPARMNIDQSGLFADVRLGGQELRGTIKRESATEGNNGTLTMTAVSTDQKYKLTIAPFSTPRGVRVAQIAGVSESPVGGSQNNPVVSRWTATRAILEPTSCATQLSHANP